MEKAIKLFEDKSIRVQWDEEEEKWYFSVQDIIQVLTDSKDVKQYIKKIKSRDLELKNNWGTICTLVAMETHDGKKRKIQAADTQSLLRIIQSIPSPKAEPFKKWLAKVGSERIDELNDPEISIDRALESYLKLGYSEKWINQRIKSIEIRKELTDEWNERGVKKGKEYSILTNEMTKVWAGKSIKEYKKHKGLKKENLRDNMTNLELVLNMLAEASTTEISKEKKPKGLKQNKSVAKKGGNAAKQARLEIEKETGKPIISSLNAQKLLDKKKKIN